MYLKNPRKCNWHAGTVYSMLKRYQYDNTYIHPNVVEILVPLLNSEGFDITDINACIVFIREASNPPLGKIRFYGSDDDRSLFLASTRLNPNRVMDFTLASSYHRHLLATAAATAAAAAAATATAEAEAAVAVATAAAAAAASTGKRVRDPTAAPTKSRKFD